MTRESVQLLLLGALALALGALLLAFAVFGIAGWRNFA